MRSAPRSVSTPGETFQTGQVRELQAASVSGDCVADMRARLETDVLSEKPDVVAAKLLEGRVAVVLGAKQYICRKGEAFYYPAAKPHCIRNKGKGKAKFLWISTPPNF